MKKFRKKLHTQKLTYFNAGLWFVTQHNFFWNLRVENPHQCRPFSESWNKKLPVNSVTVIVAKCLKKEINFRKIIAKQKGNKFYEKKTPKNSPYTSYDFHPLSWKIWTSCSASLSRNWKRKKDNFLKKFRKKLYTQKFTYFNAGLICHSISTIFFGI